MFWLKPREREDERNCSKTMFLVLWAGINASIFVIVSNCLPLTGTLFQLGGCCGELPGGVQLLLFSLSIYAEAEPCSQTRWSGCRRNKMQQRFPRHVYRRTVPGTATDNFLFWFFHIGFWRIYYILDKQVKLRLTKTSRVKKELVLKLV